VKYKRRRFMVEIINIEKELKNGNPTDFVIVTFKSDLGTTYTCRTTYETANNQDELMKFIYDKAKFLDTKATPIPTIDKPIVFTGDDLIKPEPEKSAEQIFLEAIPQLEQWKKYAELGIITEEIYTAKLNEVKLLIPLDYFKIAVIKG